MKVHAVMVVLNSVIHDSRVLREASALYENGYDVTVIGMKENSLKPTKFEFKIELIDLKSRSIFPKNILGWFIKYMEFFIRSLIKSVSLKADILHAHDLPALLPSFLASRILGVKIIYDAHELFTEMTHAYNNIPNRIWRQIEKILLSRVDGTIAANLSRAKIMKQDYGSPTLPTVIMNIPASKIIKKESLLFRNFLEDKGVSDKRIILYQGGIMIDRNIDILIKSVPFWDQRAVLILMGFGNVDELNVLNAIILEKKIDHRVFFHPPVPSSEVLNYTTSADIGIVIYKNNCRNNYYCAPNKLFEYAAAKVKVAGCDFPEVKQILEKYGIGITFSSDCKRSIAACINRLLDIKIEERRYLSLFEDYNWNCESHKLIKLYKKIDS